MIVDVVNVKKDNKILFTALQDQDIIEQLNSTYIDGKIYCKVRREKSSVVLDREFNLGREDFHFMLAIGSRFTGNFTICVL